MNESHGATPMQLALLVLNWWVVMVTLFGDFSCPEIGVRNIYTFSNFWKYIISD